MLVRAQDRWSVPVMVSDPLALARLPDLALDEQGVAHVVWNQTVPGQKEDLDLVHYSAGSEQGWSVPNDIVPPRTSIGHVAVAADLAGAVHLVFTGSRLDSSALYHQGAAIDKAWSAANWSQPHLLNQGSSRMGAISIDSAGIIHVVYDDAVSYGDEDPVSGVFYRHSVNAGQSWTLPASLHASPTGDPVQPSIHMDSQDVIHVTWVEHQVDLARSGVYVLSTDGGSTWGPYTAVVYPDLTIAQLAAGSDGRGGVMLVWRTVSRDEVFYQWSVDQGQSWDAPATLPEIWSRPWQEGEMDVYDMVADSAGQIHLLLVGRRSLHADALLGLYHMAWDGSRWSYPAPVFESPERYPEFPQLVIYEGNSLHATWATRERSLWDQAVTRQVWYATGQAPAPYQPVVSRPTPATVQTTVAARSVSTPTPQGTWNGEGGGLPKGLYTDNDDVLWMAVALAPVALILLILLVIRSSWFQRLWW